MCVTVSTAPKEKADAKMSKNKKKKMKKKMKKKQQLLEQQRLQLEELERGQVCSVCVIMFGGKEFLFRLLSSQACLEMIGSLGSNGDVLRSR